MRTLIATDLTAPGASPFPWRALRSAVSPSRQAADPSLGPWATPAGFEFADAADPTDAGSFRVELVDRPRSRKRAGTERPPLPRDPGQRALPAVILPPGARGLPPALADGLTLEVCRACGRVEVAEAAWPHATGPVLLAISQCWRLLQIERELDELDDWIRGHPDGPTRKPARRRDAVARMRRVRTLVSDLVSVEGPLTDPRGYFDSAVDARLYRAIAARIGFRAWRERLDERIEVAEAAIEALVEERRHRQLMVYEVGLELLILLALLLDLGLNLWLLTLE